MARIAINVLFVLVLVGAILVCWNVYTNLPIEGGIYLSELNDLKESAKTLLIETNKTLISLALLIFGAVGAYMLEVFKVQRVTSNYHKVLLSLSLLFAAVSIACGYVIYDNLIEMFDENFFEPRADQISIPLLYQLMTFGASVVLIGLFALDALWFPKGGVEK